MKILIIEDEKNLAESLKLGLEKESYIVELSFNGQSGLDEVIINHKDYDLVILDLMLPNLNGLEVSQRIRQHGIHLPILMLTALDKTDDKVTGLDKGADDYLVKPFEFNELLARIRALLRRPPVALPLELSVAGLKLNPATRQVFVSDREVTLSTKEFSLLLYFMRNQGQVLTREDILNHAWNFEAEYFSNIVDAHVKNLRKKIDDIGKERKLETIRGVGYRLKK